MRPTTPFLLGLHAACTAALSQTCTPAWDTTIGEPGITSDGYAGPMCVWNDGRSEKLFIGGSFTAAGGYLARGIVAYDPANSDTPWSALGQGCYSNFTNSFVAAIASHNFGQGSRLVVGGSFETAGGVASTTNLGIWNGVTWSSLPGSVNGAIWSLTSWNGALYAGGGFTSAGSTPANGIAKYGSDGWEALGSGIGGGYSPAVFALLPHNDGSGTKLYAGGRFSSLGGVAGLIARWTGTAWQPVGGGVASGSTFADIECFAVFNDGRGPALYAGGWDLRPSGQALTNVARWDGTRWTSIGQYLGGRTTGLAAFDDGTGIALYAGGTAQPGINYIAKLVANRWEIVSGGIGQPGGPPWPSVFGAIAWNDHLYVAGDFDYAGPDQQPASGLAAWSRCTQACPADFNLDGSVEGQDVEAFFLAFESADPRADLDQNGGIDGQDVEFFFLAWESGC